MARVAIDAQTVEERLQRAELAIGIILDLLIKPNFIALTSMPPEIEALCTEIVNQIDRELKERDMEGSN